MSRQKEKKKRKIFLIISLIANLGMLFFFKYFNFLNDSLMDLCNSLNIFYNVPSFRLLLPVGISFYTFQTLSYSIEVYRGNQKAEEHLGIFALYVAFFPQLVAGPIERSTHLLPQFIKKNFFEYDRTVSGLKLILWGFFMKLVIADRVAIYVNSVYNNHEHHSGITLITATVFFAFQIYCDFAGYSNIAIGSARIMGFDLMENFKRPYFAGSISEFWSRWHISLSTWFKDYLYIPLGGNRVARWRWFHNLLIVFVISGLWHGAAWTFVIWGLLHGLYLILGIIFNNYFKKPPMFSHNVINKVIRTFGVFTLVCFSWIFFRANSVTDAFAICKNLLKAGTLYIGTPSNFVFALMGIAILVAAELNEELFDGKVSLFNHDNCAIRHLSYLTTTIMIILFGVFDGGQFIYFQF